MLQIPWWIALGRQMLKSRLAHHAPPPLIAPPVNQQLLEHLLAEQKKGRKIVLATAAHATSLESILRSFSFDEVLASDDTRNLKGAAKAQALVARFGHKGFDYAGDSFADEAIWACARRAIVVSRYPRRIRRWSGMFEVDQSITPDPQSTWQDWLRALRVHQWSKNLLIAVPFMAGHHFFAAWQLAGLLAAFLAMCLCASGTYLWNDLLDLDFDRAHPHKKNRLAAASLTSIPRILLVSLALVMAGLAGAFTLKPIFGFLLIGYIILTLSYSMVLKRIAIADIFTLAFLYLSRIVGGILISSAVVSFWLFAFTFLLFLSLAAVKRFTELQRTADNGTNPIAGRGYRTQDILLVSELGVSAGVASAVVLGLYSNSPEVIQLYTRPYWFWGVCVAALFWISRIWFLTKRGAMHDDPVVFALKDKTTWLIAVLAMTCILLAHPLPAP
jgi:4-hydroxybenzoate polyprenyltransferase